MNKHAALAIQALVGLKGDDLERAQSAFKGLSLEKMNEQYGGGRNTRAEMVAQYKARAKACDEAIEWVKGVKS